MRKGTSEASGHVLCRMYHVFVPCVFQETHQRPVEILQ